jgi:hypothetical protein
VRKRGLNAGYMNFLLVVLLFAGTLQAQWAPGGNSTTTDISRTGKVGVMTTGTPLSQFHVFTATSMDGIAVDGSTNPAINLRNAGTIKGYLGLATAANAFFTGSVANDLILRSEGGRILIGQAPGAPAMTIGGGTVNISAPTTIGVAADASVPRFVIYDDGTNTSYSTYGTDTITRYKSTASYSWNSVPRGTTRMSDAGTQNMILDPYGNLAVTGEIKSLSAGFRFPDGTIQTTAATGGGVSAAGVSAGNFGANSAGGNYSFPAKLGVGTSTPGTTLDVAAGVTPRGLDSDVVIGSTIPQIEFYRPESSAAISYDASYLRFWLNGPGFIPGLIVGTTGHVGVGTSSAPQPLTVPITASGYGISLGTSASLSAGQFAFVGQTGTDGTFNLGNLSSNDNGAAGMAIVHTSAGAGNSAELAFVTHNAGTDSRERMRIDRSGKVGIGVTTPTLKMEVAQTSTSTAYAADPTQFGLGVINDSGITESWSNIAFAQQSQGSVKASVGAQFHAGNVTDVVLATDNGTFVAEKMRITGTGLVGIGTSTPVAALDVNGDIHASGTITGAKVINAVFQDVAEWVPTTETLAAGTVVVLNPAKGSQVAPSKVAYDTTVAGVVSAHPGIVLGTEAPDKAQIATTGRVRVKVDASHHPIKVGDLLVTSDVPGTAMRSIPVEIAGISMHRPGTIIGKALEPIETGTGEILVLLSLQ